MDDRTLRYANITLESAGLNGMLEFDTGDTEIRYDYFDSIVSNGGNRPAEVYKIKNQLDVIGYIALYYIDTANQTADIYGKINGKRYYGDFIKAFTALIEYAFRGLKLKRLSLVYRQDNYFIDDVCRHLGFIREGLLRGRLNCEGRPIDVNTYGMLSHEYRRLANGPYRRMFAWDYSFNPENVVHLGLEEHFNRRLFTNSIDNPNCARINDWLSEYVMNRAVPEEQCLTYKGIKFPVRIFDMDFEFDCFLCGRQEISVLEGRYTDLLLVATAQFGDKQTYITAVYGDGTREECPFHVGDWCNKIARDEHVIHHAAACRELGWGSNIVKCDAHLYLQRVHIDSDKQLKKLIFPMENNKIFIFAGALCEE